MHIGPWYGRKVPALFASRLGYRAVACKYVRSMDTSTDAGSVKSPNRTAEISEGRARVIFPNSNQVFYNPVQEFNRDLR